MSAREHGRIADVVMAPLSLLPFELRRRTGETSRCAASILTVELTPMRAPPNDIIEGPCTKID